MSLIAKGFLRSLSGVSGSGYVGSFVSSSNTQYMVAAALANKGVPNLACASAKLTYDDLNALTGAQTFEGKIERESVQFKFSKGAVIEGKLDGLAHTKGMTVVGTSVWTQA